MPVLGRSPSLTIGNNGELLGIISENFSKGQPPFHLNLPPSEGGSATFYIQKDIRNQESDKPRGYGAGTRVLFTLVTCERKPLAKMVPVVALWPDSQNGPYPLTASLIESALDPQITFNPLTGRFHLYYWVNAWSPPGNPTNNDTEESTLFNSVKPPSPTEEDIDYRTPNSETRFSSPRSFLGTRDLPEWYLAGQEPSGYGEYNQIFPIQPPTQEKIGPFNISNFWIAPWTDEHLYRFNANYDPTPDPPVSAPNPVPYPPPPPGSPPTPPIPPVTPVSSQSFLDNFPYANIPQLPVPIEVSIALYKHRNSQPLKSTELATLQDYFLAPRRLMNLARCVRVLMHTTGTIYILNRKDDYEIPVSSGGGALPVTNNTEVGESDPYLVVDAPQPVLALPRASNKVMVVRHKWTSFVNSEDVYVTAPLNYRYPAAGTVALTAGNPQLDFTIHDPCDHLDYWRRGLMLPESDFPQRAQQLPEKDLIFPGVPSYTLIGLMSDLSIWNGY
jgi:hypothetical protein